MFRVSCIQLCSSNNVDYNLKITKRLILKAIKQKTDFILTPEVSSKISLDKSFGNVKLTGAYVPSFDCNWNFASSIMK